MEILPDSKSELLTANLDFNGLLKNQSSLRKKRLLIIVPDEFQKTKAETEVGTNFNIELQKGLIEPTKEISNQMFN